MGEEVDGGEDEEGLKGDGGVQRRRRRRRRCHHIGTDDRTRKDRATQAKDHGRLR